MMPGLEPAPIGDVVRALGWPGVATTPPLRDIVLEAMGWPRRRFIDGGENGDRAHTRPLPALVSPSAHSPPPKVIPSELRQISGVSKSSEAARPELGPLRLPSAAEHEPLFAKPIAPLFEPRLARAILGRIAGVRLRRGEVDIEVVVATIARGRPITKLPRRLVATVSLGLQLLLDISPAMNPFRDDVFQLIRQLKRTIGSTRLDIQRFERCPSIGVEDDETGERKAYMPPRPGVPVLAVTDLGLIRARPTERALQAERWRDLHRQLTGQGTPLAVLTPYSHERLADTSLTRRLRLAVWDRGTGVRGVPPAVTIGRPGE